MNLRLPPSVPLVPIMLVALGYLGLGLIGLALAIPPGYASPVFPAAGFATAMMLTSERRLWPGIALGSLLLNLGAGDLSEASRLTTVIAALGIAAGSTLQAHVAARLVNKVSNRGWLSMEDERDIVSILLTAGPLACLVSASIGTSTLYLTGLAPAADLLFTWWNWWTGDTLGVLIALPLSLTLLLRTQRPWRGRVAALWPPMLTALLVITAGYVAVSHWERDGRHLEISRHGEQLAKRLDQRFIAHQEALAALKRLIEVTPDMSYAQFDHFTRITLGENPDIFALSFNPYVRHAEREAFQRRMALATQQPDFEIRERDAQKRLVAAGTRTDYVVVGYIAPLEGNRPAVGYDINSEPVRQDAIRRARASQHLSVTSTIRLVQENQARVGALLLYPAYHTTTGKDQARDSELLGFAVGVIKLDQMVQIATDSVRMPGLAFHIDDVTDGGSSAVYRSADAASTNFPAASLTITLAIADRTWKLTVYPTAAYLLEHRPWTAWATGVVGLLLAALLQVLLLVTTGHADAAERKVRKQSEALKMQGAELQDRTTLINMLFELSPDGFLAFAPDGTIRFANPAFHAMTGIPPAQVIGQSIASLDDRLRLGAEQPDHYISLDSLFASGPDATRMLRLVLLRPCETVLQIVGVRSSGASIDRFAYFRDVTVEAEVDRMKSEFLSHAAHELRTPMASIFGFSELLVNQEFDDATRKDMLETIHRQTAWLVDIINELLDLARIESRRGKDFKIAAVPLQPLLDEVVAAMQIDAKQWRFILASAGDMPPLQADAAKLRQALTNVLGNAVKYSPAGGNIEIRCTEREQEGRPFVGITITDHGIGMRPDQVARVCERFYRADSSGQIPGTGLGMSIVKEIVELHGGSIAIDSTFGAGTTVTLWLPIAGEIQALPTT